MRLLNITLGLGLMLGSLTLPLKAQYIFQEDSQIIRDKNQIITRGISRNDIRKNSFYPYCRKPRLTIRAKYLEVERIYRYSIYCGKQVLHGWRFYQRGNRQGDRLRAYLYDRQGYLLEEKELRLRKYDRRRRGRRVSLFISPKVGSVIIQRVNSSRDYYRYDHRNRSGEDDDDD